jgi:hypothetical protein
MADSQYDQFLQEATTQDRACDRALGRNRLYGLNTNWCFQSQAAPAQEADFWTVMRKKRIRPQRIGLRMKGPAAADFILASYPGLV